MAEKNLFQWGPYQEAALESGLSLFGNLTTQVEKITRLQLEAGAEATREALAAAQALIEIKDPAELGNWQTTYWQPGLERVADTVRKQYDLLAESRSVVLDAIKEASAEATQQVQAGIDRLAEQAPEAGLIPAIGDPLRPQALKWMMWLTNTLQALLIHYFYPERLVNDGDSAAADGMPIYLRLDEPTLREVARMTAGE